VHEVPVAKVTRRLIGTTEPKFEKFPASLKSRH
jgi:hypothetical protein